MTTENDTGTDAGTTDAPTPDDLDLRGDVLEGASMALTRECPEADCDADEHHLAEQYPAVVRTGAWGKYLNPVYRCQGCETAHTLLVYESGPDADQPAWGAYPPEKADCMAGKPLEGEDA